VERQAWNRLESGVEIDLTREQFQREKTLGDPEVREPLASASTRGRDRYTFLSEAVLSRLGQSQVAIGPAAQGR
jgi:hypothetical protein